jgi:hypothetical protein
MPFIAGRIPDLMRNENLAIAERNPIRVSSPMPPADNSNGSAIGFHDWFSWMIFTRPLAPSTSSQSPSSYTGGP